MSMRSIRYRFNESNNIWPGFVDVLATLLIVIIFILMIFTVSQIYLSDAISGKDRALQDLRYQINELSKILIIETKEKQKVLDNLKLNKENLTQAELDLRNQQIFSQDLQANISKKDSALFIQEQNILVLGDQIKELLTELRIVATALETYEEVEISKLSTKGLGERINKALASRIDQLSKLNKNLDLANNSLSMTQDALSAKIEELSISNNNLLAINDSLGLGDASLVEQLLAIQKKNDLLKTSELELQNTLNLLENNNKKLLLKDAALQEQINQYQAITNDLLEINNTLGIKDASLNDQLEAIRSKNSKLAELNVNLLKKDTTILNLREKILELNNILTIGEERKIIQDKEILNLNEAVESLQSTNRIESDKSLQKITEMGASSKETMKQVAFLSDEIELLKNEISLLNGALESSELSVLNKELKIEVLGERLNKALTSKVFELQKYRSEFFGKLQSILGDRRDIKIVGDRFIFESELLFDSASANLQSYGIEKLREIGLTLKETTNDIPNDIDWIIQVEGHTDKRPIKNLQYPSNWELSTARANSVLKLLLDLGFPPNRLSAAGYGEFYPIQEGDTIKDLQQNRRIELKLTSR